MTADRTTFDTNIFFYAVDPSAGEKNAQALRLLESADPRRSFVVLQTLGELCFTVGKKRRDLLPSAHRSARDVMAFFDTVVAAPSDLPEAIAAQQLHGLQFWDAMLWATARRAGCTLLFSEDMQDGWSLGGVVFRNPFKMTTQELETLLA